MLRESIRDLSLKLEDRGWNRLTENTENFSKNALDQAGRDGRALAVAHPLVRRGLALRASYIHGNGGPQITASHENEKVNLLVQEWWASPENQKSLTSMQARTRLERSLSTDGNVFIASFTNPKTGQVTHRTILFEEIIKIHTNPDDRMEAWFYEREYVNQETRATKTLLYPDINYSPARKPNTINGKIVMWQSPVRHVKVNDLDGWEYGIGDTYSIAPWARAYRDFLQDWATLMRSLSQFAWRTKTSKQNIDRAVEVLQRATNVPGNPTSAGGNYIHAIGEGLEAIPKTGATVDSESGRPLLAMIAAGLDVPVTMLASDPGTTGARAVAETLDAPMYLSMKARRDVWGEVYRDLALYAVEQSVRAPQGVLTGKIVVDEWARTDRAVIDGSTPLIQTAWPDLSTNTVTELVDAVIKADSSRKLPPLLIARLLLEALNVDDIDAVLRELTDDDGEFKDPYANIGEALVKAFNQGIDPASVLNGSIKK